MVRKTIFVTMLGVLTACGDQGVGHYQSELFLTNEYAPNSECGIASWYGPGFHGRRTANGTVYNQWGKSAACAYNLLNKWITVTNKSNGRKITIKCTDTGNFRTGHNRVIDLSRGARDALGGGDLTRVCYGVH